MKEYVEQLIKAYEERIIVLSQSAQKEKASAKIATYGAVISDLENMLRDCKE